LISAGVKVDFISAMLLLQQFPKRMRVILRCSPAAIFSSQGGSLTSRASSRASISSAVLPVAHTIKM
jgi:hypothetical protein